MQRHWLSFLENVLMCGMKRETDILYLTLVLKQRQELRNSRLPSSKLLLFWEAIFKSNMNISY